MVCGPVVSDQSSAVDAEYNGQVLEGDFLEDLVEASLQES